MAFTTVYDLNTDSNARVTMRWQEPYVTEGINKKFAVAIPEGIYRGWRLGWTGGSGSLTVRIEADALTGDHVAVVRTAAGNAFTLRYGAGNFDISLAAVAGLTAVVALYVVYDFDTTTESEIRAYSLAQWAALTDAERAELVVLGTVDVPMTGAIPAANIRHERRTESWERVAPGAVPWTSLLQNGDFEWGPVGSSTLNSFPPWEHDVPTNGSWSLANTDAATGDQCLVLMRGAAVTAVSGSMWQAINAPLGAAGYFRLRLQYKVAQAAASGSLSLVVRFRNTAGTPIDVTESLTLASVTTTYQLVDKLVEVPAGASQLSELRITAAGLTFGSLGVAVKIDAVQLFLASSGPFEANAEMSTKAPVVTNAVVLTDPTAGASANSARISIAPSGGVGSGPLVTLGRSDNDTALSAQLPTTQLVGQARITGADKGDLVATEGDLRIGTAAYRLKFGVAQVTGAGTATIAADGGTNTLHLGAGASTAAQQTLTLKGQRVGVNDTNPAAELTLGAPTSSGYILLGGLSNGPMVTHNKAAFTSGSYDGAGQYGLFKEPELVTLGVPSGYGAGFAFKVFDSDSTGTDLVRITDTGFVGVGTTTPVARLDIVGLDNWDLVSTEGDVHLGDATYGLKAGIALTGGNAGDAYIAASGGVNRLTLGAGTSPSSQQTLTLTAGKAGIQTAAPLAALQVVGADTVSGRPSVAAVVGSGAGVDVLIGSAGGTTAYVYAQGASWLELGTNNSARLQLSPTGSMNVLGDVYQTGKLTVSSLGSAGRILVNGSNTPILTVDYDSFTSGSYTGAGRYGLFMEPSTLALGTPAGSGVLAFKGFNADSTSVEYARFATNGSLGIGTTTPSASLHVKAVSTGSVSVPLVLEGSAASHTQDIRLTSNTGGLRLLASPNSQSGIADSACVQIFGTAHASLSGRVYVDSGSSNTAAVIFRTAPDLTGLAERMRVTATGEIGIGTDTVRSGAKVEILADDTAELVLSSLSQSGSGQISFVADRFSNTDVEWRPGFLASEDDGDFTGRLSIYTNGAGSGAATGTVHAASFINGRVAIGATVAPNGRLEVYALPAVHSIYTTGGAGVGTTAGVGNNGSYGVYSNGGLAANGGFVGLVPQAGGNGGYGVYAKGGQGGLGATYAPLGTLGASGPGGSGLRGDGGLGRIGASGVVVFGGSAAGATGGTGGSGAETWGAVGGAGGPTAVGVGAVVGASGGVGGSGLQAYGGQGGSGSAGANGGATGVGGNGGNGLYAKGGAYGAGGPGTPRNGAGVVAIGGNSGSTAGTVPDDTGVYANASTNGYAGYFDHRVHITTTAALLRTLTVANTSDYTPLRVMPASTTTPPASFNLMGDLWVGSDGKLWFHTGSAWKQVSLI